MVVDDEEKIRYVVRKMLGGEGYEVIEAGKNGAISKIFQAMGNPLRLQA